VDIGLVVIEPIECYCLTGCKGIDNILLKEAALVEEGRVLTIIDMQPVVVVQLLLETELLLYILAFIEL
jgi:hypothetical protein